MNPTLSLLKQVIIGLLALLAGPAFAATCTSTAAGGNWNAAGTWTGCGGGTPGSGDTAVIATSSGNVVTANVVITVGAVIINANAKLNVAGSNWTVNGATNISGTIDQTNTGGNCTFIGAVTVNPGGDFLNSIGESCAFRGGITNDGNFDGGAAGTITFNTNNQVLGGSQPMNFNAISLANNIVLTNSNTNIVTVNGTLNGGNANSTWINDTNTTLNYAAAAAPMATGTLTANATGNTVNYSRAGTQTVKAPSAVSGTATYYNLTFSGSGAKTLPATVMNIANDLTTSDTATVTTTANLSVGNDANIGAGTTLTVAGFNMSVIGATSVSGALTHSGATGTKTYTGTVIINSGGTWSETAAANISFGGDLQNDGTFTSSTGTHSFTAASANLLGANAISFGTGTVTANSLVVNKSGSSVTTNGTLTVNTNLTVTAGTLNLANTTSITGTTSVTGTLAHTTATGTRTFTGNVTVNSGGTWSETAVATLSFGGNLQNDGTFTANTGVHTFTGGATKTFSGANAIAIPSVTISGTYQNNGTLTVTTALAGGGALTNGASGTLNINFTGAVGITTLNAAPAGNTVSYVFAGAQTVSAVTYHHLSLANSGAKTLAGATTVNGNLTVASGVTLDGTTNNPNVAVLGNITNAGTFNAGSGTWSLNGSVVQSVNGVAAIPKLTVNNATGVISSIDLSVSTALTLTNGAITMGVGANTLSYTAANCSATPIVRTNGYVYGNLTLTFPNAAVSCLYPVGDFGGYKPVTAAIAAAGTGTMTARVDPVVVGTSPSTYPAGLDSNASVTHYWTLTRGSLPAAALGSLGVTFGFTDGDWDSSQATTADFVIASNVAAAGWNINASTNAGASPSYTAQATAINGASMGNALFIVGARTGTLLADWHMEESAWNGTTDEVVDSSGNGYAATAGTAGTTKPTTAFVNDPAYTSGVGQSTCRYGQFDTAAGQRTYAQVKASFPKLTNSYTVGAWVRSTNASSNHQRIFVNDDADNGWAVSLADGTATPVIRLFNRNVVFAGVSGGVISAGGVAIDTPSVLTNNAWYFVATSVDTVNKRATVYVYNSSLVQQAKVSATYTGTWCAAGTCTGATAIGGETAASSEGVQDSWHFVGNIDDMRVWNYPLTQGQLTTSGVMDRTRVCSAFHHLEIQSGGSGVTCTASTLTIKACADNGSPCTGYTGGVSGTMTATGTPTVIWTGGTGFSIGAGLSSTTKDVQVTTAGTVVFGIAAPSPLPASGTTCNFGSPTCTFTSALAGFLVSAPNHVSCTPQTLTVTAVKQSDSSLACVPAFSSTSKTTTISFAYGNPATGTHVPVVGGTSISTAGTSKSLSFDASGIATPSLVYDDVGQLGITVSYTGSGADAGLSMTGTTSPGIIVAPSSFSFSGITAAPITAGANFNATVTALNACGSPAATPNFGKEASAEGVTLSFARTSPAGVNNPVTGPSDGSFSGSVGAFSGGGASGSNLNWSEVGQGTLTATLTSGSYLGSGLTASGSTASGAVGRFKPAYFNTAVTVPGCSTFTYSGQPFTVTVTANKQGGGTTVNYSGAAGFGTSNATTLSDANGGTGTWANNVLATTDFVSGVGTKNTVSYAFASRQTAPTAIAIRAVETAGDSVTSATHTEGTTTIYSGRIRLLNANGSELLDLPATLRSEYWVSSTAGWQLNSADTCSGNAAGPVSLALSGGPAAFTCVQDSGNPGNSGAGCPVAGLAARQFLKSGVTGFAGDFNLWLKAPGSGNAGAVTVTSTVPAWLQYPWTSSTPSSPIGRATFGVFKSGPVIFRREMY